MIVRISLSKRLLLSHVLVATLTSFVGLLLLLLLVSTQLKAVDNQRLMTMLSTTFWLFDFNKAEQASYNLPDGYTVVASPEGQVIYVLGNTSCRVGEAVVSCLQSGEALDTVTGQHIYANYPQIEPGSLALSLLLPTLFIVLLSLPLAFLLAWLASGGLSRRLMMLATVHRRFGEGDFGVRAVDTRKDEIGELARQFNSMADVLTQNMDLLRQLVQRNIDLLRQAEQDAAKTERLRLARDLHDSILQQLFSLSTYAATLPNILQSNPDQALPQIERIVALAEQSKLELRELLIDLRHSSIIEYGLEEALRQLGDRWAHTHGLNISYTFALRSERLPASLEDVIYRVAEEGLHNVMKHASATGVDLSVLEGRQQIIMSITDNGQGFDTARATNGEKFGLVGMRERARTVGGTVTIESDSHWGTTIQLSLPFEKDEAP